MKKMRKITILIVSMIVLFSFSVTASAAEISETQDGLVASIVSEKDSYNSNEDIDLTFKVTNTNYFAVDNVSLEAIIPEGLKLKSENTNADVVSLDAGESLELKLTVIKDDSITVVPTETQPQSAESETVAETKSVETTTKANSDTYDTNNNVNNSDNTAIKTGNDTSYMSVGLICIFALAVAVLAFKFRKKAVKSLSIVLCICISASCVAVVGVTNTFAQETVDTDSLTSFEISKSIEVDNEDYEIKANITYNKILKTPESSTYVTRGQWVDMLASEFSMKIDNIHEIEIPFTDVENHKYYDSIIAVYCNAILPTDITKFEPDSYISRDLAAFTLNNCLCFVKNNDLVCDDFDKIKYKDAVSALVENGYFVLNNNKFNPNSFVTTAEMDNITSLIKKSLKKFEINPQHENVIDVKEDVVDFKNDVVKSVSGNTVVLEFNEDTSNLTAGDVFIAPNPENNIDSIAFKVESITKSNDEIKLVVSQPELSELYNRVSVQGVAKSGISNKVGNSVGRNINADNSVGGFDWFSVHYSDNYSLDASKFQFKKKYEIKTDDGDKILVELDGGLKNPEIEYIIDFDISNMSEFKVYTALKNDLVFNGKAEVLLGKGSGTLQIAKVPVQLCPGVSVDVIVNLVVGVDGKVTINYSLENTVGVMITNEGAQFKKDFGNSNFSAEAEVNMKLGISPGVVLSLCGNELIGINAELGGKGNANAKLLKDEKVHTNFSSYMYFEVGYSVKNDILKKACGLINLETEKTYEIINKGNSPFKGTIHFEGFEIVDRCTYRYVFGEVKSNDFPVSGATVSIYSDNFIINTEAIITNDFGKFEYLIPISCVIDYDDEFTFKVQQKGYDDFEVKKEVKVGEDTTLGVFELMPKSESLSGTMSGTVIDNIMNNYLSDVRVDAYLKTDAGSQFADTTYTDENGNFSINLNDGSYELRFSKDGYKSVTITATISNNQMFVLKDPIVMEKEENYRDEFINALLESEDQWYENWGTPIVYPSALMFTDLNFDGKLEFIMQYGGGWICNCEADAYYFDGNNICLATSDNITANRLGFENILTGYYDTQNEKYLLIGTPRCRVSMAEVWKGNYVLNFDGKNLSTDYYSSVWFNKGYDWNTENQKTQYYNGASGYANVDGITEISEVEYNKINEEKLKNLVDINMKREQILCSDWENYSNSEKREALERIYDSFTYDKY